MKQSVTNILTIYRAIMLPFAEARQYGWPEEFKAKNSENTYDRVRSIKVDVSDLTASEAELLGFPLWDASGLRLIPLWLYPHLAHGQPLTCIDGSTKLVGNGYMESGAPGYIDNDHRGGAIAYGFVPVSEPALVAAE